MTVVPNPSVLTAVARQRRDELQAAADRERLARLAAHHRGADRRLPWADVAAVAAIVVALALLFAAGSDVAQPSSQPERLSLTHADGRAVSQVLDEHLLDPAAALAVNAARQ